MRPMRPQSHHTNRIRTRLYRRREGKKPADPLRPAELDLPQQSHRLQPDEHFFDPFTFPLTSGVVGVKYGALNAYPVAYP